MNKKEKDQLKKIDQLDQQLDNTINKIGATKVKPIKISKKKLALFMLIPFSIACVISALTSFLVIDPFHWYTKSRLPLEEQQEKEIKRIKQAFERLNLASGLDNTKTIFDLLWEVKNHPNIKNIVTSANDIKDVISKKENTSKLSADGEYVNIKIIVKTGSLEKEINVELFVIIENKNVKQVNKLVKHSDFLNSITNEIQADGIKRVSNLVDVIKTIINKNEVYKTVFNDIQFEIVDDNNDNEIIVSGLKTLNVNFNFTENNKLISSSVKLNLDLKGKSRKEINQALANKLKNYPLVVANFFNWHSYIAQTVFAGSESTYKDLIDELISRASKNNFFLAKDAFKEFDNKDSRISVDFTIDGKDSEQLNDKIDINSGKVWTTVKINI